MALAVPTVQVDNDRMVVTSWKFGPGAETGFHVHRFDYAVVPMVDGELRIELCDGASSSATLQRGVSYARAAGVEHNIVNANSYDFEFIEIELR